MVVCDIDTYTNEIMPMVCRLKFDYFGHEGVVIHSREIRKAQKDFNLENALYESAKYSGFTFSEYKHQKLSEAIEKLNSWFHLIVNYFVLLRYLFVKEASDYQE